MLKPCKKKYDLGGSPLEDVGAIASHCLEKIDSEAVARFQAKLETKNYSVFAAKDLLSRPFLPAMLLHKPDEFERRWQELLGKLNPTTSRIDMGEEKVNLILYTAITAVCVCFDLWKPRSRKTPGTFLEVLLGSVLGRLLPRHKRTKFIPIPEQSESVSTDIVFTNSTATKGIVFPAKITTRERIVQPFAHQRILESVFGKGRYQSILLCVSETQRDKHSAVNEICVPGTIRLFQSYLACLSGIYYLDPPNRYLKPDVTSVIPVGSLGLFLTSALPALSRL
jgi:hypothetical protein